MNRRDTIAFTVRFLGAVLVAIGIGGAVVGGYATFQESAGLCGTPELEIRSSGSAVPSAGSPALDASDLSSAERAAFVAAVEGPANTAEIDGPISTAALRNGAVVGYQGERYYAVIGSLNGCVSVDPLVFALGATLLVLGGVAFVGPTVRRRLESFRES